MKKLLIIIFILAFAYSYAQIKNEPRIFTLNECIDIALKNNYDIQLAYSQLNVNSADITNAFGQFLPTLAYNLGYNRQLNAQGASVINVGGINIPIPATNPNSYNMNAYASYTIFNGFNKSANYKRAQESYEAQELTIQQTQINVKLSVLRQYIDIIKKSEIVKIRQENIELGKQLLDRIQAQYDAGTISITNLYAQEADLGNREYELVISENDVNVAKTVLLNTMGLSTDIQAEFSESSLPAKIEDDEITKFRLNIGGQSNAVNTAFLNRQDYAASKSNISAAEANVTYSESGYYPSLSASGGYTWSNYQFTDFSANARTFIGLSLSIPIFDNFNTNFRIQSSKVQLKQREIESAQLEQTIKTSVQTALLNLESAEKQLDLTKKTQSYAELNYESFSEKFKVGTAGITDYQNANNQLITSKINRINAIYTYFQAQKEVLYTIGKL
ncbi:MAG: TolC family protein [FCB group bacterium]|jgi:outer membrane protein